MVAYIDKRIIKIQSEIQNKLNKINGVTTHFIERDTYIDVCTYNEDNDTIFLLYSNKDKAKHYDQKVDIRHWLDVSEHINNMIDYLNNEHVEDDNGLETYNSYTVIWMSIGEDESKNIREKSYFYAKNMAETLDKFYYGKNKEDYKIFSIDLNPIS